MVCLGCGMEIAYENGYFSYSFAALYCRRIFTYWSILIHLAQFYFLIFRLQDIFYPNFMYIYIYICIFVSNKKANLHLAPPFDFRSGALGTCDTAPKFRHDHAHRVNTIQQCRDIHQDLTRTHLCLGLIKYEASWNSVLYFLSYNVQNISVIQKQRGRCGTINHQIVQSPKHEKTKIFTNPTQWNSIATKMKGPKSLLVIYML